MKNIIPFKKDVIFKTNISEITSISLEHTLSIEKEKISGDFIINGEYKISDNSSTVEPFDLKIPFEISLDERFDTDKATLDIDDFFYEIINNSVLSLSIDVLVDNNGNIIKEVNRCTYLATDLEEAKCYGDVILQVEYDPFKHKKKNNYIDGCWQVRVYEPIPISKIQEIKL